MSHTSISKNTVPPQEVSPVQKDYDPKSDSFNDLVHQVLREMDETSSSSQENESERSAQHLRKHNRNDHKWNQKTLTSTLSRLSTSSQDAAENTRAGFHKLPSRPKHNTYGTALRKSLNKINFTPYLKAKKKSESQSRHQEISPENFNHNASSDTQHQIVKIDEVEPFHKTRQLSRANDLNNSFAVQSPTRLAGDKRAIDSSRQVMVNWSQNTHRYVRPKPVHLEKSKSRDQPSSKSDQAQPGYDFLHKETVKKTSEIQASSLPELMTGLSAVCIKSNDVKPTERKWSDRILMEASTKTNEDVKNLSTDPSPFPREESTLVNGDSGKEDQDEKTSKGKKKKAWFSFYKKKSSRDKNITGTNSFQTPETNERLPFSSVFSPRSSTQHQDTPVANNDTSFLTDRIKMLEITNNSMKTTLEALNSQLVDIYKLENNHSNLSRLPAPLILPLSTEKDNVVLGGYLDEASLSEHSKLIIQVQQATMEKLSFKNQKLQSLVTCQTKPVTKSSQEDNSPTISRQLSIDLKDTQNKLLEKERAFNDLQKLYEARNMLLQSMEDRVHQLEKQLHEEQQRCLEAAENFKAEEQKYSIMAGNLSAKNLHLQSLLLKERKSHLTDTLYYEQKLKLLQKTNCFHIPSIHKPEANASSQVKLSFHDVHMNNNVPEKTLTAEPSLLDPSRIKQPNTILSNEHKQRKILGQLSNDPVYLQKEKNGFYILEKIEHTEKPSISFEAPAELIDWAIGSSKPTGQVSFAQHQHPCILEEDTSRHVPKVTTNETSHHSSITYQLDDNLL